MYECMRRVYRVFARYLLKLLMYECMRRVYPVFARYLGDWHQVPAYCQQAARTHWPQGPEQLPRPRHRRVSRGPSLKLLVYEALSY
jgi:hypothetical protein